MMSNCNLGFDASHSGPRQAIFEAVCSAFECYLLLYDINIFNKESRECL